jgi:hypothetical protein
MITDYEPFKEEWRNILLLDLLICGNEYTEAFSFIQELEG